MAITITTTTHVNDFIDWLVQSDSYKNSFSYEGAIALSEYLDELSDELESPLEYDPEAWCMEFTEYSNLEEIQGQYPDIQTLDDLRDNTQVIEFDNGIIIQDF